MPHPISRRIVIRASTVAALAATFMPRIAQSAEPIAIGTLTPNTGGGSPYGAGMASALKRTADQINAFGGLHGGRMIALTQEDSETNPETAVRAADKLINVNRVSAILGTWASSVTLGIMPKCQSANVIQMCTSSSSDIPTRDLKQLCFNFQVLNPVWGRALGQLALTQGFKTFSVMAPNNDFTISLVKGFVDFVGNEKLLEQPFYYNVNQSSYRAEVSRLLQKNPQAVFVPGYVTDFTAVYKDIYRAGYKGRVITVSIATDGPFKNAIGEAADGILHGIPVPPLDSPAYKQYLKEAKLEDNGRIQDPYATACRDQMSVLALAIEKAGSTDPEKVRKAIFDVTTGTGKKAVYNVIDGLRALRAGEQINYSGAGSEVEFDKDRQLVGRDVQLYEIKGGKDNILSTLKYKA
jgi:neutral amino acid transport system substrate-binding protein